MNNQMQGANPSKSIVCLVSQNDKIVGVGFLISDQHILTCAHVVNAALGRDPRTQSRPLLAETMAVKFPTLGGRGDIPFRQGHVVEWYAPPVQPRFEFGDIACVAMNEARPMEAVPAVVGIPTSEPAQQALVFGYPSDPPRPEGVWVQCELAPEVGGGFLQLGGSSVIGLRAQPGFSGSPVWLQGRKVVVGMLAIAPSGGETRDAYAISARDFATIYRSMSGSDPLAPPELVASRRVFKTLSADLARWRKFISDAAESGWINLTHEMPSVDTWHEHKNILSQRAPETLTNSLAMVYRYFEALLESRDQLDTYKRNKILSLQNTIDRSEGGGAGAAGAGLGWVLFNVPSSNWFFLKMRRKQLKDQDFQNRLRALPEALGALIQALETEDNESVREPYLESLQLPAVPRVRTIGESIRFALEPIRTT